MRKSCSPSWFSIISPSFLHHLPPLLPSAPGPGTPPVRRQVSVQSVATAWRRLGVMRISEVKEEDLWIFIVRSCWIMYLLALYYIILLYCISVVFYSSMMMIYCPNLLGGYFGKKFDVKGRCVLSPQGWLRNRSTGPRLIESFTHLMVFIWVCPETGSKSHAGLKSCSLENSHFGVSSIPVYLMFKRNLLYSWLFVPNHEIEGGHVEHLPDSPTNSNL